MLGVYSRGKIQEIEPNPEYTRGRCLSAEKQRGRGGGGVKLTQITVIIWLYTPVASLSTLWANSLQVLHPDFLTIFQWNLGDIKVNTSSHHYIPFHISAGKKSAEKNLFTSNRSKWFDVTSFRSSSS